MDGPYHCGGCWVLLFFCLISFVCHPLLNSHMMLWPQFLVDMYLILPPLCVGKIKFNTYWFLYPGGSGPTLTFYNTKAVDWEWAEPGPGLGWWLLAGLCVEERPKCLQKKKAIAFRPQPGPKRTRMDLRWTNKLIKYQHAVNNWDLKLSQNREKWVMTSY